MSRGGVRGDRVAHTRPKDPVLRRFDHIDDLHTLTVYGLTRLAREFYGELIGGFHESKTHNTGNDQLHRNETEG